MARTEEEIQADEIRHKKKLEDIDKMKEAYRKRADRMERINPASLDFPVLTVEEVEDIEKELPEDFTDAHIEKALKKRKIDVQDRRLKAADARNKSLKIPIKQ